MESSSQVKRSLVPRLMTFTVQSSCTRAGIVCASYTDSRAGECRNRVFLKNSNRCCGVSVLTARVVKVYMRTARVYIYRLAYSCVSVCADARGGGIGSTRGSPSESGTFHCRTRGGRIAIDPVTSHSPLENFFFVSRTREISLLFGAHRFIAR